MTSAAFWNKKADKYFEEPIKFPKLYEKKLEITRSYMQPTDRVFEFGCGTGGTAILHSAYVKDYVATDISDRMIEIGRREAKRLALTTYTSKQSALRIMIPPSRSTWCSGSAFCT